MTVLVGRSVRGDYFGGGVVWRMTILMGAFGGMAAGKMHGAILR
jgi:hypothetical protein